MVDLPHGSFELPGEPAIVLAALGIRVGMLIGMIGTVFFPEQRQGHAFLA